MKGTLFSSDFVVAQDGSLKLIEINTDTAIQDSLASSQLDWASFLSNLSSNSITELHVIYKNVQKSIVDSLEVALTASGQAISFNRVIEADNSIYPTVITDSADKFILRLAFDAGAIFDSEYAAKDLNVYKLFIDNGLANKVPGTYYSGSEYTSIIDTLEDSVNEDNQADLALRRLQSAKGHDISFYKLGNTSDTPANRIAAAKAELSTLGEAITNYYVPSGASKASSIRTYSIIYGDNLDVLTVGSYKIEAILDFPSSLDVDLSSNTSKIPNKHFSEFSVEGINRTGGILHNHSLVRADGGSDLATNVVIGDQYLSYFVSGSPDTDQYGTLFQWSHGGDVMPSGSGKVNSTLLSSDSHNSINNASIKIELTNGEVLRVAGLTNLIVHQASTDSIRYIYASSLTVNDSLYNVDGEKVAIAALTAEIHDTEGESTSFEYNLEDTDTFTVSGSNVIVHNAPCFIPGTLITIPNGCVKIEDVKVGDLVATYNHELETQELKEVLDVTVKENVEIITIEFENGSTVGCTFDHPFYVKGKGYASFSPVETKKEAGMDVAELEEGDEVFTFNLDYVKIVNMAPAGTAPVVYNLSRIQDNKNFYANGSLVHNRYK